MTLTPDLEEEIKARAAKDIADRFWQKKENELENAICFSLHRAGGMLEISPAQLRRIAEEHIDLGSRDSRISLAELKRILAARTVRKADIESRRGQRKQY